MATWTPPRSRPGSGGWRAVETVQVSRQWPHTIVIAVTLRHPVAAVPVDGTHQYVEVDAEGVPFRTVSARHDLPIIKPGGSGSVDLSDPAVRAAVAAAAQILVSLPPKLSDQLVRLEAPSASGVVLVMSGGRSIVWGDSTDNAQKARVAESLLAQPGKVIDVSAPTVVTIR